MEGVCIGKGGFWHNPHPHASERSFVPPLFSIPTVQTTSPSFMCTRHYISNPMPHQLSLQKKGFGWCLIMYTFMHPAMSHWCNHFIRLQEGSNGPGSLSKHAAHYIVHRKGPNGSRLYSTHSGVDRHRLGKIDI